ncbi:polysaccharide biosynthesis protein [Alkalibaculum bacchi]|nr:polysaccharide biosynthesis protein [Alkalibaculum bacchi]
MKKSSRKNFIFMSLLEMISLAISFSFSLILVDIWYAGNLLQFLYGGLVVVLMSKLSVILIFFKFYAQSKQLNKVLAIVAIYNLFSFICLYLINVECLYEICTINLLVDVLFIGINRNLERKAQEKRDAARVSVMSPNKKKAFSNFSKKEMSSYTPTPLIIVKDLKMKELKQIKNFAPNGIILNISLQDENFVYIDDLRDKINEIGFDSIVVYTKNFYRLEFLDIFEITKDMPFSIELLDENYSLTELTNIEDIIKYFPLNIESSGDFIDENILLLYTGDVCVELCEQIIEKGAKGITVVDYEANLLQLYQRYMDHNEIVLISAQPEGVVEQEVFEGHQRIVYGLPIDDIEKCESDIKSCIERNIVYTKKILQSIPESVKTFTFVSSSLAEKPKSIMGNCYGNVESLVRSRDKYMETCYQVVRLPNYLKRDNPFIRELRQYPFNKVVEANPKDIFVHLYDKEEAVRILLSCIQKKESVGVYVGHQIFLPNFISEMNYRGLLEEKIHVTFTKGAYPLKLYIAHQALGHMSSDKLDSYVYELPEVKVDYYLALKVVDIIEAKLQMGLLEECRKYLKQLTEEKLYIYSAYSS